MPCVSAYLLLLVVSFTNANDVNTANGVVSGRPLTVDGRTVWEYVGIPFAKPPVGELRFRAPQPLEEKWSKPLIADKPGNGCLQPATPVIKWPDHLQPKFGEDCLYLDIWTPSVDPAAKRAVMIFIHGGGFVVGTALPLHNASALSSMGDVVVVTIHYRLGFLGFARFDGSEVPGNNGLLDQQMAMRWVSENIAGFGGDPESVTIFGESAGSASVSFHLMNQESGRLFKRGIMESGALGNPWAMCGGSVPVEMEKVSRKMAEDFLNCSSEDVSALIECLQSKTEAEMNDAVNKYSTAHPVGPFHCPTVDGEFVRYPPSDILTSGQILKKDVIIGLMEQEVSLFTMFTLLGAAAAANYSGPDITSLADEAFVNSTIDAMFKYFPNYPQKISPVAKEMIRLRALSQVNPQRGDLNIVKLVKMLGAFMFDCGVNAFADAIRAVHENVYFYELAFRPTKPLLLQGVDAPAWMKATHADDILLVFALPIVLPDLITASEDEMHLSRRIITDFTTFAKTGAPRDPNWRRFTPEKKEFYRYGVRSTFESGGVRREECLFWDKIVPMVNELERRNGCE